ncbi:MAG: hypothetical protein ACRDMV_21315 [Streptosporangiales bacterium]
MPLTTLYAAAATVLAAAGNSNVTTGLLGFIVIALLGIALFFLVRSMNKQIRRINVDGKDANGFPVDDEKKPDGEDQHRGE